MQSPASYASMPSLVNSLFLMHAGAATTVNRGLPHARLRHCKNRTSLTYVPHRAFTGTVVYGSWSLAEVKSADMVRNWHVEKAVLVCNRGSRRLYASTLPFYWLTRNYLLRKASETFSGSKDQARPLLCRLDFCAIGSASDTQVVLPTSLLERAWSRNRQSCRLDCWSCEQKACASTLVPGDEPSTHVRSATVADRQEGVPANTASLLAPTWGTSISPNCRRTPCNEGRSDDQRGRALC